MKHRSLQERLIAEAESLRAGVPTQATCDGISRLLVEAAAAVESPAMTDTKALLELAEQIDRELAENDGEKIGADVSMSVAGQLRALAAQAPAADAQQAVVVDEPACEARIEALFRKLGFDGIEGIPGWPTTYSRDSCNVEAMIANGALLRDFDEFVGYVHTTGAQG